MYIFFVGRRRALRKSKQMQKEIIITQLGFYVLDFRWTRLVKYACLLCVNVHVYPSIHPSLSVRVSTRRHDLRTSVVLDWRISLRHSAATTCSISPRPPSIDGACESKATALTYTHRRVCAVSVAEPLRRPISHTTPPAAPAWSHWRSILTVLTIWTHCGSISVVFVPNIVAGGPGLRRFVVVLGLEADKASRSILRISRSAIEPHTGGWNPRPLPMMVRTFGPNF